MKIAKRQELLSHRSFWLAVLFVVVTKVKILLALDSPRTFSLLEIYELEGEKWSSGRRAVRGCIDVRR